MTVDFTAVYPYCRRGLVRFARAAGLVFSSFIAFRPVDMSSTPLDVYKEAEEKRRHERESAEQNSLFREVDDDLRHDLFLTLWKRYGMWVIAVAVAIVLAVAGYQIYRGMQESERASQAAIFDSAEAAFARGDVAKATELLFGLETKGNAGYRTLARLHHAASLLKQDKRAEARDLFRQVAADAKALSSYRDLATVLDALAGIDDDDPKALVERLSLLTAAGHPWRHMALEVTALALAKGGDPGRAAAALKEILDDPDTSADQRAMADSLRTVFARDAAAK